MASDPQADRRGAVIAGRYRLVRPLGEGGMGEVWEAEHTLMRRRVAIKLLRADRARRGEAVKRMIHEAEAAGRVRHPNTVEVLDVGADVDGTVFLVQELLEGVDLRRHLAARGALSPAEAVGLLVPVMEGAAAAHRLAILHRDIKPENVFLARGAGGAVVPRLIDFGLSKILDATRESLTLTREGSILGTPYYLSPEQARGETSVGAGADVWAMGVIFFEAIAGRHPFQAPNYNALMIAIVSDPIPRLDAVAPDVPAALADAVARALDRDRARRFEDMGAFLDAVRAATTDGLPTAAAATTEASPLAHAPTLPAMPSRAPRSPRRIALAAGALALGALTAAYALRPRATTPPAVRASPARAAVPAAPSQVTALVLTPAPAPLATHDAGATEPPVATPRPVRPAVRPPAPRVVAAAPDASPPPREAPAAPTTGIMSDFDRVR
ncbi:MAG: serine/threonine-protein kinase [Polyangiales bacterium]